jgi:hypothetical protein
LRHLPPGHGANHLQQDSLAKLNPDYAPGELQAKLDSARDLFKKRESLGEDLGFYVSDIPKKVNSVTLTNADINQFCVHPRLDLSSATTARTGPNALAARAATAARGAPRPLRWPTTPQQRRYQEGMGEQVSLGIESRLGFPDAPNASSNRLASSAITK